MGRFHRGHWRATGNHPTTSGAGAAPFYTVAYGVRAGGRAQAVRHTPTPYRAQEIRLPRFQTVSAAREFGARL